MLVLMVIITAMLLYSCEEDKEETIVPEEYGIKIISGDNQLVEAGEKAGIIRIQILHQGKPIPKTDFLQGMNGSKFILDVLERNACNLHLNDGYLNIVDDGIAELHLIASPNEGKQEYEVSLNRGANYAKITSTIVHLTAVKPPPTKKVFCMGTCNRLFSGESETLFLYTINRNGNFYYSDDGGETWNNTTKLYELLPFAIGNGKLFFANIGAVFYSSDKGASYITYTNQLNGTPTYMNYTNDKLFMSFGQYSVYSTNNGQTWDTCFAKRAFSQLLFSSNGSYILISNDSVFTASSETATPSYRPVNGKVKTMCKKQNDWYLLTEQKSVYKSNNNGENWQLVADISSHIESFDTRTGIFKYGNGYFYVSSNDKTIKKTSDFLSFNSLTSDYNIPYFIPLEGKNASLYIGNRSFLYKRVGF